VIILPKLTNRQVEVLQLVIVGDSNYVIADKLDVTPNTIKAHLAVIFKLLKVCNRAEALFALIAAEDARFTTGNIHFHSKVLEYNGVGERRGIER